MYKITKVLLKGQHSKQIMNQRYELGIGVYQYYVYKKSTLFQYNIHSHLIKGMYNMVEKRFFVQKIFICGEN